MRRMIKNGRESLAQEHIHIMTRQGQRAHQRRGQQEIAEMIQPNDDSFHAAT